MNFLFTLLFIFLLTSACSSQNKKTEKTYYLTNDLRTISAPAENSKRLFTYFFEKAQEMNKCLDDNNVKKARFTISLKVQKTKSQFKFVSNFDNCNIQNELSNEQDYLESNYNPDYLNAMKNKIFSISFVKSAKYLLVTASKFDLDNKEILDNKFLINFYKNHGTNFAKSSKYQFQSNQ